MDADQWWDVSWNPVDGCIPVSPACDNCWARGIAERFWVWEKDRNFSDIRFHPERLEQPLKWKKPRRIFTVSMGDFCHTSVLLVWQSRILTIIEECPQHTFFILTKRPQNWVFEELPDNLWIGVTVESQEYVWRIEELSKILAAKRFLSIEPMLGEVDINDYLWKFNENYQPPRFLDEGENYRVSPVLPSGQIHWVIVGAETGPGARPMNVEWATSIQKQCHEAEVPFWFKKGSKNIPCPSTLIKRERPTNDDTNV